MARTLKVAAVGIRPPAAGPDAAEPARAVARVLHHIERELAPAFAWGPELVVLPEGCDRPLDLPQAGAAAWSRHGAPEIQAALCRMAREHRCVLVYSRGGSDGTLAIEQDGKPAPVGPASIVHSSVGKLVVLVSGDVESRELPERVRSLGPDVVLVCSRFPGGVLEQHLAFACRAHLASAVLSRWDLRFPCRVISPVGSILAASTTAQTHARARINLDSMVVHLDDNREKLLALQREMGDAVAINDPGRLGAVLVSNEAPGGTIGEILARAGIATIDEYFTRYLAERGRSLASPKP